MLTVIGAAFVVTGLLQMSQCQEGVNKCQDLCSLLLMATPKSLYPGLPKVVLGVICLGMGLRPPLARSDRIEQQMTTECNKTAQLS